MFIKSLEIHCEILRLHHLRFQIPTALGLTNFLLSDLIKVWLKIDFDSYQLFLTYSNLRKLLITRQRVIILTNKKVKKLTELV